MEKKHLISLIDDTVCLFGFKRKGDHWVLDAGAIVKMINLQKSAFKDAYYVNYGYIIKALGLGNLKMHVYRRLGSADISEREKIDHLLDLNAAVSDRERTVGLKRMIDIVVQAMKDINTEEELLKELREKSNPNSIPISVKNYFNMKKS